MKKVLLMMLAAMMVCIVACKDEDAVGEAPEIESIELTPNPCKPGETVMLKVNYSKGTPGQNFYFIEYVVRNLIPVSPTKKDATHGVLLGSDEPNIKCLAPDSAGNYTVSFMGKISFTGNKAVVGKDSKGNKIIRDGQLYGETNTASAKLTVQ